MFIKGFVNNLVNLNAEFYPLIDTEEDYKLNLISQPYNWEYRNKKVLYKYNSLGHRSCELHELVKDYILFAGCSFTEGIGLKLEDTFSYLVSQKLALPYYNLAIGGSCPVITVKNIITFLTQFINNMPKYIVIQWPCFFRYYKVQSYMNIEHYTPAGKEDHVYKALLEHDDAYRYNIGERLYLLHFLHNIKYSGKVIELFSQESKEIDYITKLDNTTSFKYIVKTELPRSLDFARDLSHPGSLTNKSYANLILKNLSAPL